MKIIKAQSKDPMSIKLDPKGYFKISISNHEIHADYYNYDHKHLLSIIGHDARNIYWTILEKDLISRMDHAAYLGKELTRAEYALHNNSAYKQC